MCASVPISFCFISVDTGNCLNYVKEGPILCVLQKHGVNLSFFLVPFRILFYLCCLDSLVKLGTDLCIYQNRATDSGNKTSRIVTRDENFNFRAAHWADIHSLLYKGLPPGLILWGHEFISFETSTDKSTVRVKCRVAETGDNVEMEVDLLVAADGCLSAIRQNFLPNLKLRYASLRPKSCLGKFEYISIASIIKWLLCVKLDITRLYDLRILEPTLG